MDRFALIADIHGNADALEAVLADIDALGIGDVGNLGDHVSGPLDPAGTAALLRARPEMVMVRGNHDRAVSCNPREALGATDGFTWDRITDADRDWLREMPLTAELGGVAFLCHATPRHDETYWVEVATGPETVGLRGLEEIAAEAEGIDLPVLACGHSHLPRATRLPDGRLLVNPGSVGCPAYRDATPYPHAMQTGSADACYAVVEKVGGVWRAVFRLAPYDFSRMAAAARAAGREDWARAVETGRAG